MSRDLYSPIFSHLSVPSGPVIDMLKHFLTWIRFREDVQCSPQMFEFLTPWLQGHRGVFITHANISAKSKPDVKILYNIKKGVRHHEKLRGVKNLVTHRKTRFWYFFFFSGGIFRCSSSSLNLCLFTFTSEATGLYIYIKKNMKRKYLKLIMIFG